mmetsp:Transcript_17232/g.32184  ORF Transcript_17232/g.32184 Transcript_17232/m.32184 type:complete len:292 (+) Transcript_17232:2089-2964(+)
MPQRIFFFVMRRPVFLSFFVMRNFKPKSTRNIKSLKCSNHSTLLAKLGLKPQFQGAKKTCQNVIASMKRRQVLRLGSLGMTRPFRLASTLKRLLSSSINAACKAPPSLLSWTLLLLSLNFFTTSLLLFNALITALPSLLYTTLCWLRVPTSDLSRSLALEDFLFTAFLRLFNEELIPSLNLADLSLKDRSLKDPDLLDDLLIDARSSPPFTGVTEVALNEPDMLEDIRANIVGQEGSKREGQAGRWGRRFHPEVNRGKRRGRKGVWDFEGGDLGIVLGGRGYWRWERAGCV